MWKKLDQLRLDHSVKQSGGTTTSSAVASSSTAGGSAKSSSDKPLTNGPTSPPSAMTTNKNGSVVADSKRWSHTHPSLSGTNHSSNNY